MDEKQAGTAPELPEVTEPDGQRLEVSSEASVPYDTDMLYALLEEANPETIVVEGLEDACIGRGEWLAEETFAVYDYDRCLRILTAEHGTTEAAAIRYLHHDILGADHGLNSPVFVSRVHVPRDQFEAGPECVYDSLFDANPLAETIAGLESAYLGIGRRVGREPFAVYDYDESVYSLMEADSLSPEDARVDLDCSYLGTHTGPNTPVFVCYVRDSVEVTKQPHAGTPISLKAVGSPKGRRAVG